MRTHFLYIATVIFLLSCESTKNAKNTTSAPETTTTSTTSTAAKTEEKTTTVKTATNPNATLLSTSIASGIEKEILQLINQHRKSKGLSPLSEFAPMTVEARKHSVNMASGKVKFGHFGFDSRRDQVVAQRPSITAFAENVAYGSKSATEVVKGWLNSPGHKKNIEGNYTYSGIGVARNSKNQLYFTQIFAR